MSNDKEVKKAGDQSNDSADHRVDKTTKKTADEAVADAPMAKRHGDSFRSFSDGTKAITPLVLEDSKTGQKFYDANDRSKHATTDSENKNWFKFDVTVPLPDYKTSMTPGIHIPRVLIVEIGPKDNASIELRYQQELHGKDFSKMSDGDREKYRNAAICDVLVDKYQQALSKQALNEAANMPPPMKGLFLAGTALQDGATVGGCKAALHKIITENELGNLAAGAGAGVLLGEVIQLGAKLHPWTRTAALVLQAGGIGLLAKQVTEIGSAEVTGLLNSFPALQEVINHPSEKNFNHAKETVEKQIGPPVGEGALLAVGFVATQSAEKGIIHSIKITKSKFSGKGTETNTGPMDESKVSDSIKNIKSGEHVFDVDDFGKLRRMKIGDQEQILMSSGGFFKGKTSELHEAVSPTKVHVLTDSAKDLHNLQAELIPALNKDPILMKYVEEWKTMDPLFGLGKPGRSGAVAPDGIDQGAKAFTIYTKTAEDALIVNKRLEEICTAKGLGLKKPISTENCDTVNGASKRIGIVRDTFPECQDATGHHGSGIDEVVTNKICNDFKVAHGNRLNDSQLRQLEESTGIENGLLAYSGDGRLMLRTTGRNGEKYHAGWYADESEAVKTVGHLTERPALYSLYKKFGFDPAEVAAQLERKNYE